MPVFRVKSRKSLIRGGQDVPTSPNLWRRFVGDNGLQKWVFYLPALFMLLFSIVPLALTVVWSVFERTTFWMEPGFTLFAYESFFTSARAENYLFSMIHSSWAVVISFIIGFPIAVFVRRRIPQVAQHRVILLFILPFMISELVRVFAMRPVLGRHGLINNLLIEIGIINEPISIILFSPIGVVIGDVMSFLPFMVFAGFLAMEAVQKYVFEVCDDLGARAVHTFRDVIIPLAAPGIFAGGVFIFVNSLGVGLVPTILGGPEQSMPD
jgi:ABC-type spermidine/putrescine transport system permease subunit I